jgi:hypothetical protein
MDLVTISNDSFVTEAISSRMPLTPAEPVWWSSLSLRTVRKGVCFQEFRKIFHFLRNIFEGFDKSQSGESKFPKTIPEVGVAVIQSLVNNF